MEDIHNLKVLVQECLDQDFRTQFRYVKEEAPGIGDYVVMRSLAHFLGELGIRLDTSDIKKALDASRQWHESVDGKKLWTHEIEESNEVAYNISCGESIQ
jgi:hypothetical protein